MKQHLSQYLCGFREGYNSEYCLMLMLEKWKRSLDKKNIAGALLTDLSKAFDCLDHELLIAKLNAYGFDRKSLLYIYSYLTEIKHRTKVNNSFSKWTNITSGVPQGSILGPLLFNIYLNDIFYFLDDHLLASYADDNTPYAVGKDVETVLNKLNNNTRILSLWFKDNYFKMNVEKCHLLITSQNDNISTTINGINILNKKSVKLLGIKIDNDLNFKEHILDLCNKANLKLHALARVSHLMDQRKLRILMKAFVESQFGYCPLLWMFHSRKINNRINKLHERALRIAHKNYKSSFDQLLIIDNSFTIHHRNLQRLAIEMFKVRNNLSPKFMETVFPISTHDYDLRTNVPFQRSNVHTVNYGTETISFRGPKTWAIVPNEIKYSRNLVIFKAKIKTWMPIGCGCRLCKVYIPNYGFIYSFLYIVLFLSTLLYF